MKRKDDKFNMILSLPTGEVMENPSYHDFLELLDEENECWDYGNVILKIDTTTLLISFDKNYGYYILDLEAYKAVLGNEKDKSLLVVYDMGGDPFLVPLCCHLTYTQTKSFLLNVIKLGHKTAISEYGNWYNIYEGQNESFIDNELFHSCRFDDILRIKSGQVSEK